MAALSALRNSLPFWKRAGEGHVPDGAPGSAFANGRIRPRIISRRSRELFPFLEESQRPNKSNRKQHVPGVSGSVPNLCRFTPAVLRGLFIPNKNSAHKFYVRCYVSPHILSGPFVPRFPIIP